MFLNSLLADPAKWYPLLFDTPLNAVRSVAIWLTLALLVAFIVCAALLKGEKRARISFFPSRRTELKKFFLFPCSSCLPQSPQTRWRCP